MIMNAANWILHNRLPMGGVESVSDSNLEYLIAQAAPLSGIKNIQAVPALDGSWNLSIADVLLRLGEYTFPYARTPLGGLTRLIPVLKYMYCFEKNINGQIVTSDLIDMAVYSTRSKISEELGIGFSLITAEKWMRDTFGLSIVRFFDIELVSKNKYPNVSHAINKPKKRTLRADWLVRASSPSKPKKEYLFLVESKGTGTAGAHKPMLQKAVQQLAATTVDNQALQGLGVCTYSPLGGLTIYAIDPPRDDENSNLPFLETPHSVKGDYRVLREGAGEWYEHPMAIDDRGFSDREPHLGLDLRSEPLSRLCALQTALNLAHWSSDYRLLDSLHHAFRTPSPMGLRSKLEFEYRLETSQGWAVGYVVPIPGCRAALFSGVLEKISLALADLDFEQANILNAEAHGSARGEAVRPTAENVEIGNLAISGSGAVLAIIDL
ncbi:hypothetical protein M0E87_12350 [Corynebacterium sp. CCM 9185]|uniref:Uncharacterized protein n=1 Tax=Corynebacterium marambiense TaxID=2765364 RepID=A0ABS0W2D8_9CORY|nr:hypothetical protein [Corynebacterium marambiense]MBI9001752.1 hypothetical protein [Corynebacterium marambiense]MCK7664431.1 hypothetical protein [Corynebacterium marambiense]